MLVELIENSVCRKKVGRLLLNFRITTKLEEKRRNWGRVYKLWIITRNGNVTLSLVENSAAARDNMRFDESVKKIFEDCYGILESQQN